MRTHAWLLCLPLAGLLALFGDDYHLRFVAEILITGTAVMSLDILVGQGRLVSLGHAALFGGAAYVSALLAIHAGAGLVPVLLAGIATGMLLALVMGLVATRSVDLFFLILTLVVGQMVYELAFHWRTVTGGADGLRGIPALVLHLGGEAWKPTGARFLFLLAAGLALVAYLLARSFLAAPIGRALVASREQPVRLAALGYEVRRLRLLAMLFAGGIAGAAGALYPFVNLYVGPNLVHWSMSATMIVMLVLGGVGTLHGAFVGTGLYLLVQTYLSSFTDRWQLLIGILFVLIVIFLPDGIVRPGWWRRQA